MRDDLVPGAFCIDNSSDEEPFAGFHNPASDWNGWACPGFPRPEAERIATWTNQMYADDPDPTRMTWDGDVLVMLEPDYADEPGYQPQRFAPDADGLYWIGAWSWTWSEANEAEQAEPDEEGGDEPAAAHHGPDTVPALVRAPILRPFLDLSIRHLPDSERRDIARAPSTVITHGNGAWVHVAPREADHDPLDEEQGPAPRWAQFPHLRQVLLAARSLGAWWVNLDRDGHDVFPSLPTFDQ